MPGRPLYFFQGTSPGGVEYSWEFDYFTGWMFYPELLAYVVRRWKVRLPDPDQSNWFPDSLMPPVVSGKLARFQYPTEFTPVIRESGEVDGYLFRDPRSEGQP